MQRKRHSGQNVATIIPSYVEFQALQAGPGCRWQLIKDIVQECNARYRCLLYAVIRERGVVHEDAEEIVQDILFRWSQRLETGRNLPVPEALTAWFIIVARRAAITHLRRTRWTRTMAEIDFENPGFGAQQRTPLGDLALRELPKVVARILKDRCTPAMCEIFYLRCDGNTYPEVAAMLKDRSAEAVRKVMERVLGILREELTSLGWGA